MQSLEISFVFKSDLSHTTVKNDYEISLPDTMKDQKNRMDEDF